VVGKILAEVDSATEDEEFGKGNSAVKIDLSLRQGEAPSEPASTMEGNRSDRDPGSAEPRP
jgi:hypothetical protein